jgi:2-dehydro-3-deoxyphosphogluconate aldolase/(4S)-4-hydroxy-2-oxoglutarate aldolase
VTAQIETHRTDPLAAAIRDRRLIAVLRRIEPRTRLIDFVHELVEDGVRVFEITFDGVDPAGDVAAVRAELATRAEPDAWVGAGTIRTTGQVDAAVAAGAAFAVSPVLDGAVLVAAREAGLPFIPGTYTPTEADAAWRAGATFVKLFPGSSLGPAHVREMRGPLPEIQTIVTGGVDESNAGAFLAAGAIAVGIGSALARMDRSTRVELVAGLGRS